MNNNKMTIIYFEHGLQRSETFDFMDYFVDEEGIMIISFWGRKEKKEVQIATPELGEIIINGENKTMDIIQDYERKKYPELKELHDNMQRKLDEWEETVNGS